MLNLPIPAGAEYLRSLGFSNTAEIARVLDIAMNPNSLYSKFRDRKRSVNAFVSSSHTHCHLQMSSRPARIPTCCLQARKLDVEQDIKPVCEFLLAQGIPAASLAKVCSSSCISKHLICDVHSQLTLGMHMQVISEHPPTICYSVSERLQPFWEFLNSIGIEAPAQTVMKRPSILGLDASRNLRSIVSYLQSVGHSPEEIETFLETSI